jgi:hypothetical protein
MVLSEVGMTVDEGSHSKTGLRRGRRLSFRRLSRLEAPSLGAPSPLPEREPPPVGRGEELEQFRGLIAWGT